MAQPLSDDARTQALDKLPDWRFAEGALHTAYAAGSARDALRLVALIGDLAEEANHHPDVDWRYDHVLVRTTSHDAGNSVTERDIDLAGRISAAARSLGARAEAGKPAATG